MSKIYAPFSDEQVKNLNDYQKLGIVHPFTCGKDHDGNRVLVATNNGWVCPTCDYSQNWAHEFMGTNVQEIKDQWNSSELGKVHPIS